MKPRVLPTWQTFKGLSYGEWAAIWTNWFLSKDVDSYKGQDILFLRGYVNYRPVSDVKFSIRYQNPNTFLDMTGQRQQKILEGTSIFIPITVSYNAIGCRFEGEVIKDEIELRNAVNTDVDHVASLWATIKTSDSNKSMKLVPNLESYRVESPLFKLRVPKDSALNDLVDEPLKPGTYDAVAAGYFILLNRLPPSNYRIVFGSQGPGDYATRSVYDLVVFPDNRKKPLDISGSSRYYKYINPTPKL
jgi:hypothetical protein